MYTEILITKTKKTYSKGNYKQTQRKYQEMYNPKLGKGKKHPFALLCVFVNIIKWKSYLHAFSLSMRWPFWNCIKFLVVRHHGEKDVYYTSWKREADINLHPNLLFMSTFCSSLKLNEPENRIHINVRVFLTCSLAAQTERQSDQHVQSD